MVRSPYAPAVAVTLCASLGHGASAFLAVPVGKASPNSEPPAAVPSKPRSAGEDPSQGVSSFGIAALGVAAAAFSVAYRLEAGPRARAGAARPAVVAVRAFKSDGNTARPAVAQANTGFWDSADGQIPDREVGAMAPLGFWDPCGLSTNISDETFRKYRTAELKHGRISMLATAGLLVQAMGARFVGFEGAPAGFQACTSGPGAGGFGVLVLAAGFFELKLLSDEGREPGNFGDPLWLMDPVDNSQYNGQSRNTELFYGRLAMIGFIGSITAEYISGYDAIGQWQMAGKVAGETIRKTQASF